MWISNYNKFRNEMIEKGADSKIFQMPAVKERLTHNNIENVFVNPDGTIDFDGVHMKKCEDESENYIILESITKRKDERYYIMDDPIRDDNSKSYIVTAEKIFIDENGIENEIQTKEAFSVDPKEYEDINFDDFPGVIEKTIRKDGKIIIERGKEGNIEFYDDGYWSISGDGKNRRCAIGTKDGNKVSRAIHIFEANSSRITEDYPNLEDYFKERKEGLYKCIDDQIQELTFLESQNGRLQKMLGKSLSFAEQVRSSIVGKMFFGRKANEILGERHDVIGELSEKNDDEQEK